MNLTGPGVLRAPAPTEANVPRRQRRQRGFTLVEMATVIALMVILTTVAVSSMSTLRAQTTAQHAAELVKQTYELARARASSGGSCWRVQTVDEQGNWVSVGGSATSAATGVGGGGGGGGTSGVALQLMRAKRPCEGDFGSPADFDSVERVAMPQGVRLYPSATPEAHDFKPDGRPLLPGDPPVYLQVRIEHGDQNYIVKATHSGSICMREASKGSCP